VDSFFEFRNSETISQTVCLEKLIAKVKKINVEIVQICCLSMNLLMFFYKMYCLNVGFNDYFCNNVAKN